MDYFVILTSDGNLVESFDDESEARSALDEIVRQEPEGADEYAILRYDDAGNPVGDAIAGSRLGVHA